jgi:hypothetical protein
MGDHALIPTMGIFAPERLAKILLHYPKNPENSAAWLNVGVALRRMAVHRPGDFGSLNARRLRLALRSSERSLQLDPENKGHARCVRAETSCIGA